MKQISRFFLNPSAFINQLQWSSHHVFILGAFLGMVLVETQLGNHQGLYVGLAQLLSNRLSVPLDAAIWIVSFAKLSAVLAGSFVVAEVIQFLGGILGHRTSRRVLFRRLAVVFTLILVGHMLQRAADVYYLWLGFVGLAFWAWALLLGYYSLREQFGLGFLEAASVGFFSLFLILSAWHFSLYYLQREVRSQQVSAEHGSAAVAKRISVPTAKHAFRR